MEMANSFQENFATGGHQYDSRSCSQPLNASTAFLDPKETPTMKLTDEATRAREYLLSKVEGGDCKEKGIIHNGVRSHPAPPNYDGDHCELNFDRPAGFVSIPHDFFPSTFKDEALQRIATHHAKDTTASSIMEMAAFIKEVQLKVVETAKSNIMKTHTESILDAKIPYKTTYAVNKDQLFKSWNLCNPEPELMKKYHDLLYKKFETPGVIQQLEYSIYIKCKIWPDNCTDSPGWYTCTKSGKKKQKANSVRRIINNKIRDLVRNRFSRKQDIAHGIMLGVSVSKGAKLGRRSKEKEFSLLRCVSGWKSPKHLNYCNENGYSIPEVGELETQLPPITRRSSDGFVDGREEVTCYAGSSSFKLVDYLL